MKFKIIFSILIAQTFLISILGQTALAGVEKSKTYMLTVNGKEVFVEKFKDISYTSVTLIGNSKLVIKTSRKFDKFTISPLNVGIKATKSGNSLAFSLNKPQKLVVQPDSIGEKLFIFVEAPENKVLVTDKKTVVSINDYGITGKSDKVETFALQKALDAISGNGKILYFPAGIYRTGTLSIKSNSSIYLAEGAMIKGSDKRADYPVDEGFKEADEVNDKTNYTDNGEWMTFSRLILIDNAENVKIYGRGCIDGSGSIIRPQGKPANLVRIRKSRNILIEGVILRDPAAWNTHILYSDNVVIRNVKILNDRDVHNTDGVDPDASCNVLVDNCFAYCSDDNIAIKSSNNGGLLRDVDSITIKNCIFLTKKSSLKVGTETKASVMKNILFENNDVIESDRGMALYCSDGATFEDIRFINNRFESNYPDSKQCGIHFLISDRNKRGNIGQMNKILIKDCCFVKAFPKLSIIEGFDAEHKISNITFTNFCIEGKKLNNPIEAGLKINSYVDGIVFTK